ncbi:hypothetical protein IFM51744_04714 [Aspergillus udagawae]|uniref:Uncharacterized protein n=1 Tax=Aspergillus udagawae TaxID=91492 RepID=A0ABQ1AN15_9EURO|nr:hypothetical protein IFM51744_04714 [Aspergillus udagawae]GFF84919.1 hypothetical protein IFM53868_04308 [Aspergillus udagawae]
MANPSGPGAPFEETERFKLIEIITEKLGNLTDYTHKISTFKTSYAALWLADIEKLNALSDKEPFDIYASLLVFESDHRIGQRWQQRDRQEEAVDSRKRSGEYMDLPNGKRPRRQSADVACQDRDKACILTKYSKDICQPCPLYPIWMSDENMVDVKLFFGGAALHDVRNDRPLLSGEMVTLETHDLENCPLPDTRILEMQWVLNRVLALSGTVKPNGLEDDEWHEDR